MESEDWRYTVNRFHGGSPMAIGESPGMLDASDNIVTKILLQVAQGTAMH